MLHTHSSNPKKDSQPIYVNGRVVGHVRGNVFYKNIRGSKHLLKKPPAIACDVASLAQAEQYGAVWVDVCDTETRIHYRASLAHIRQKGKQFNRGYGEQIYLLLEGWMKRAAGVFFSSENGPNLITKMNPVERFEH